MSTPALSTDVVVALLALAGTMVTATAVMIGLMVKIYKEAREANDAINHRHDDTPRAYDMLLEIHGSYGELSTIVGEIRDWRNSFSDSPWHNGAAVSRWLENWEKSQADQTRAIARIEAKLLSMCGRHKDES